jgi:hypothetical protein
VQLRDDDDSGLIGRVNDVANIDQSNAVRPSIGDLICV